MLFTRREIVEELLDFVGEQGDSGALLTAQRLINRSVMRIWNKHPWQAFTAQNPYEFSTVANQAAYPLPTYFGRPIRDAICRNLTTGRRIYWRERSEIENDDPAVGTSLASTGEPDQYWVGGVAGVSVQPSAATAYELVSSDPADTDVVVSIVGLDTNGVEVRNQYTLTGANAVAAGTWTYIREFSKAYPNSETAPTTFTSSRGNVTLRVASAGATAESLSPDESGRQHSLLNLYLTPSSVWTIALPYVRGPKKLLYDGDEVPWGWGPAVFEDMQIEWRVNRGEVGSGAAVPRPDLLDLVMEDNRTRKRPQITPYRRP